ncbi:integrin beta-8 isoform 2-T2 [Clarias gariepinus]|uniref:integrin beta-8 isoform X2 n=1 Tax=Clarias gariepinus TaxID=13013 RepID=UPI00234CD53E|nr:integrin beta-8 isoform X2 [Clarias gariepinus]
MKTTWRGSTPFPGAAMSSWLLVYWNLVLRSALLGVVSAAASSSSLPADNKCGSPLVSTCRECLSRGPDCSWCFQKSFLDGTDISERCGSAAQLMLKGCSREFIENPGVKVEANLTLSSSQVTPRDISIQLRPGSEANFIIEVKQLELYPVDLYYLVDVSASMQENLNQLKTVGENLSYRMKEHSSDFQVGFGSFVDKPVSPYIDVHPSQISNPCSDFEIDCRPAHGFIHVLPITNNMTEFKHVIQQQRISGNMDTPEGGFDAMLQAAVCQKDIGWRPEAKHLLLFMTDEPSHLALDSKLAGIVVPHDGRCHLEDGTYSQSAHMEHPTIGQLAEKLLHNNIYSVFAVKHVQYEWYEDLVAFLPGTYLGILPGNLTNLVVDAYKKLLSDVRVEVEVEDREAHRFWVSVKAVCPTGSTASGSSKCTNVQPGQKVFFNITVGMRACPERDDALRKPNNPEVKLVVKPVGFNESTIVRVRQACVCSCGGAGPCHDNPETPPCSSGINSAVERGLMDSCQDVKSGLMCSGRGTCVCGACVCDRSKLGTIYGQFCEKDDFSCPNERGVMCGGHGQCVSGECLCQPGWTGESCGCPVSTESCVSSDGLVCSGHGKCVCGKCVCDHLRRSGTFCEKCTTCSNACLSHWNCVDCHLSKGLDANDTQQCNRSCTALVAYVDDITGLIRGKYCLYHSREQCVIRFHVDMALHGPQLWISKHAECVSIYRYFKTFLGIFLFTVLLGLGILAGVRLLLRGKNWSLRGHVVQQYDVSSKVCVCLEPILCTHLQREDDYLQTRLSP